MDFYSAYAQGFARVAACTLPIALADPAANAAAVLEQARECHDDGVAVAVFPYLFIRLAAVVGDNLIQFLFQLFDFRSHNFDIRCLTFGTAANEISATTYWYQSEPHAPFCSLPAREKRGFGIRLREGLALADVADAEGLQRVLDDRLATIEHDRLVLTLRGRLLADHVVRTLV